MPIKIHNKVLFVLLICAVWAAFFLPFLTVAANRMMTPKGESLQWVQLTGLALMSYGFVVLAVALLMMTPFFSNKRLSALVVLSMVSLLMFVCGEVVIQQANGRISGLSTIRVSFGVGFWLLILILWLMALVESHYQTKLNVYFPKSEAVEFYVKTNGINAFYESIDLRKSCCHMRKVEPLQRALSGKSAWVTGMRAAQATTRASLPVREFDEGNKLEKFNPLSDWSEQEVWAYIRMFNVPYNQLHEQFYPSIGCAPCTRAIAMGEDVRAGRWWWEDPLNKECGLHVKK